MIRRLVWFLVGVLCAFTWGVSYAETKAPSQGFNVRGQTYSTLAAACAAEDAAGGGYYGYFAAPENTNFPGRYCQASKNYPWWGWGTGIDVTPMCESGWTMQNGQCFRPDCVAPETRQPDGTCANPCGPKAGQTESITYKATGDGTPVGGSTCTGGCASTVASKSQPTYSCSFGNGGLGVCFQGIVYKVTYTGAACTAEQTAPAPPASEALQVPAHKPKCTASEGVLTSSSGTVACVPEGTPDTVKPIVEEKKKVETYPDNSTKTTTETTTKDPQTGAKDIQVSVTSTGGQSGTAGTTNSQETVTATNGTGSGDASCDPKKDFCGGPGTGGLYEGKGKTVQSVMQSFNDGVSASPIGQAANGFLSVSTPGGSCPSWIASVEWFNWSMNIGSLFCTQQAITFLELFGVVILAVVSFTAFKWAIL